jgi:hypothetical protein
MLLIAYGIYHFQPLWAMRSCDALTLGPVVSAVVFCVHSIRKLHLNVFKLLSLAFLALLAMGSKAGLEFNGVQQCSEIGSQLQSVVLQRSESVTGFVSVLRLPSEFGPMLILRCDHSLIGGMYLDYKNASVFGSFYFMDFVRYVSKASAERSSKTRALQM